MSAMKYLQAVLPWIDRSLARVKTEKYVRRRRRPAALVAKSAINSEIVLTL
jgi:hypothetical protein